MGKMRESLKKPPGKPYKSVKRPTGQIDVRKAAEATCTFCASGKGLCLGPDWFGQPGRYHHRVPARKGKPAVTYVQCFAHEVWKLVDTGGVLWELNRVWPGKS